METRRRERHATYEHVYSLCQKQVMNYAKQDQYRCFYDVPEFILGMPVYHINNVLMYLMDKLRDSGFLVKYFFPKYLYISWDKDEIAGRRPKAPPRPIQLTPLQPMIAAPPAIMGGNTPSPGQSAGGSTLLMPPPQISMAAAPRAPTSSRQPSAMFPPPPMATRIPSAIPTLDQVSPTNNMGGDETKTTTSFVKSIADFKPSGKFVLNLD